MSSTSGKHKKDWFATNPINRYYISLMATGKVIWIEDARDPETAFKRALNTAGVHEPHVEETEEGTTVTAWQWQGIDFSVRRARLERL